MTASKPPDDARPSSTSPPAHSQPDRYSAQPSRPPADWPEEDNPFVAFRRFADQQMASLLQGLVGLPSAFERPRWPPRWTLSDEEAAAWRRAVEERRARGQQAGTSEDVVREDREAMGNHWAGAPHSPTPQRHGFEAPHTPPAGESFGRADSTVMSCPGQGHAAARLATYLQTSPYSPLALEEHPNLRKQGTFWRAAFTDLLAAEAASEENHSADSLAAHDGNSNRHPLPSSWHLLPPEQWTHNVAFQWAPQLWRRALLHSQEARRKEGRRQMEESLGGDLGAAWSGLLLGMLSHPSPDQEAGHPSTEAVEPATELDMYERFLDGLRPGDAQTRPDTHEASTQTDSRAEPPHPPPTLQPASQSPALVPHPTTATAATTAASPPHHPESGVVATLTTTEHVVLPDGTTRTTVALRKRFADGREERKETVQTSQGHEGSSLVERGGEKAGGERAEVKSGERKGKGWFWS